MNTGKFSLPLVSCLLLFPLTSTVEAAGIVSAWGAYYDETFGTETYRPMYVPPGLSNVTQVSAGYNHAVALKADGSLAAWGWSGGAQLSPLPAPPVVAVAAADGCSLALRPDGTVVSWGGGCYNKAIPADLTNVIAIAAGRLVAAALKNNGSLVIWGESWAGGQTVASNIVSVRAGSYHVLALSANGTLQAWSKFLTPATNIPPLLRNIASIAAGDSHCLALGSDGRLVAWGDNSSGQTNIPPGLNNVVSIACGYFHNLAVTSAGNVVAWGAGTDSAIYDLNSRTKGQSLVPPGLSNVFAVCGGLSFSLAVSEPLGVPVIQTPLINQTAGEGATVWMRTYASGANPLTYRWLYGGVPVQDATNLTLTLTNLQLNQSGSYSISVSNQFGAVTNACFLSVLPLLIPTPPQNTSVFLGNTAQFSVGAEGSHLHYQWKFNGTDLPGATSSNLVLTNAQFLQAGLYSVSVSNASTSSVPAASLRVEQIALVGDDSPLPPGLTNLLAIDAGSLHRIALTGDRLVRAWGDNSYGQTNVPPTATNVIAIAAGGYHTLALRADGTVVAWGYNQAGQTNIPPGLSNVVAIAAGTYNGLALKSDGTIVPLGTYYGDAGNIPVPAGLSNIVAIAAGGGSGYGNSAALRADGTLVVWGVNYTGQTNIPSDLTNVLSVSIGKIDHLLALKADRTVAEWPSASISGYLPAGLSNIVSISAGGYQNLALKAEGNLVPWASAYGNTNMPPGVHNVIAIAHGDMALIGDAPPVAKAALINPSVDATGFTVLIRSQSGHVYVLEYATSLQSPQWTALPLVAGTGSLLALKDPTPPGVQHFYRVRQW